MWTLSSIDEIISDLDQIETILYNLMSSEIFNFVGLNFILKESIQ